MDDKYRIEQLERDVRALQERYNILDKRLSKAEQRVYDVTATKLKNPLVSGNILYKDQK